MTSSPLDNLVRIGELKREAPAQAEFDGHVDDALVDALIRVAQEVAERVMALGDVSDACR